MHAGFLAGFGLIIFYAAGEFLNKKSPWKYLLILGLSLPITLLNPYGCKYWQYLIPAVTMHRPYISEWMPLNLFESFIKEIELKIQLVVLFFSVFICWINRKNLILKEKINFDRVEVITLAVTLYLGFCHSRHITFFSIAAAVYGYKYYAVSTQTAFNNKIIDKIKSFISEEKISLINFARFYFIYFFIIWTCILLIIKTPFAVDTSYFPDKAVEFIKINKLEGNLLVPFNWGSYAMWKLYPQNLISIDGRYEETYTNQAYADLSLIMFSKDSKAVLKVFNKYCHNLVLTEKNSNLANILTKTKYWKILYEDEKAVVIVPSGFPESKWLQPEKNKDFYTKKKYKNSIDF